jgi:F-type H+-transporting ATPase subunit gamma
MANLKEIKGRIGSVKSTQKITKAMKMISTARLNKAKTNLTNHLAYSKAMQNFVNSLIPVIGTEIETKSRIVKNFIIPKKTQTLIVVFSTDKGLCGALNTFVFKELAQNITNEDILLPLGKKAYDFTKSRYKIAINHPILTGKPEYHPDAIEEVVRILKNNNIGKIKFIFPEFISTMVQKPKMEEFREISHETTPFEIEGCPIETLEMALKEAISCEVQACLSQLLCSEHSARMIAMDNATNNATTRIKSLTLLYNKTRQAKITSEILEIISGSQAV